MMQRTWSRNVGASLRVGCLVGALVGASASASAQLAMPFEAEGVLSPQDEELRKRLRDLEAEVARLDADLEQIQGAVSTAPRPMTSPEERLAAWERHLDMEAASPYRGLDWHFAGPTNLSGRITDLAIPEPRGKTYAMYAATASGGIWKTVNEGHTWEPILDNVASTSFGEITIDPQNHDTVWVGGGEANIFRSSMAGAGIWRSQDGGDTWEHKGLAGTHTIPRILVHPENSDVIYVAAGGHEWTHNSERGVYLSRDGGDTWDKILYVDEETAAMDLVMDPRDPNVIYATTWQRIRKRWNDPRNEPHYSGSGIWRTRNGGRTWEQINEGLPVPAERGRIGIDIARSNPDVLYAFVDNYAPFDTEEPEGLDSYGRPSTGTIRGAQVWRSDDRGDHWRLVSEDEDYTSKISNTYGWVFGQIRVDPNDEDKIYVLGVALHMSEDGGKTFRPLYGMHGDHHALWIDPANSDYVINGNDGGVSVTYDGGENWQSFTDNLPAVQFFNLSLDMGEPFRAYGSVQDHGSYSGEIRFDRRRNRLRPVEFDNAPGGEGSSHAIDPTNPDIVYSAGFYGRIQRSDLSTGDRELLVPEAGEGEPPLRGQWVAPFILSPHNPRVVYHGMNILYRSMDRGDEFDAISEDLSYNELDQIGDIPYQTIFALDESPQRFGRLYAGTDDGRAWTTPDSGATWTEITAGLAPHRWISRIEASRTAEGTIYLAQNGKRWDDFQAYLWVSHDHGSTWKDLSQGIPAGPINVVREDPKNHDILYVGTDQGVYISTDRGATWSTLGEGLPSTFVSDLRIHPREDVLVISTHGRGIWVIDVQSLQDGSYRPTFGAI